jgi:pyruvate, water dikinase
VKLLASLRRFLSGSEVADQTPETADAASLRLHFAARYGAFKQLLNANKKALEVMSEVEETLALAQPFGMGYVRSQCSRLTTSVFQAIRQLHILAPERYAGLTPAFEQIKARLNTLLAPRRDVQGLPLFVPMDALRLEHASAVGGKMACLGELRNVLGLLTPDGFAATLAAYWLTLDANDLHEEINRRIQVAQTRRTDQLYALSSSLRQLVVNAPLPPALVNSLEEQARFVEQRAGGPVRWAVRSSALMEDAPGMSFAGQYLSLLGVCTDDLADAYKEVLASQYSLEAMAYRLRHGLRDQDTAMCVGFLVLAPALAGGVAGSRDPVGAEPGIHIHAAWGLPKGVVDGEATVDCFVAEPDALLRKEVAYKDIQYLKAPGEGLDRVPVPEAKRDRPCLADEQILELAGIVKRIEEHFGTPQDVEWALQHFPGAKPEFVLLNNRPLLLAPAVEHVPPPDAEESLLVQGGVTVSPGSAFGPLFKAMKQADSLRFPQGAVLLVEQAAPHWAPLLSRAAALATVSGNPAGRLAKAAREFGVPTLFLVPESCLDLPEGARITVDASGCRIYDGCVEPLCDPRKSMPNPMQGSPVYLILEQATRYILPLTLTDPDGVSFRADSCTTLHDIIRFCHEKALQEMFDSSLERKQGAAFGSAKRLVCENTPMQFWVLDLSDGFIEEPAGKTVDLENIRSAPMLAIWRGMTAKPWEGPPALDTRGFLSVMVEATANPALVTGGDSPYAARNYFMISSAFCNLQSRFGFHFCSVEALVGEHPAENYAGFTFKGGAADLDRRQRRTRFVAELLEKRDFRVSLRQDALTARIEGGSRDLMLRRLEILGYLIVHTRQLDMVMADASSVARFKAQLDRELNELHAPSS